MRKKNSTLTFLAISIALAMAAAVAAVLMLRTATHMEPVLVATRQIEAYEPISAEAVRVQEMPSSGLPGDALRSTGDAVGKYSRALLLPGTVLRKGYLAGVGDRSMLASQLTDLKDPKLRALAIPITPETGVGGKLRAGERVDLTAAVKLETPGRPAQVIVKTFARNVLVLDVPQTKGLGEQRATIIVALTPEQVDAVNFALMDANHLRVALEPYNAIEADTPALTAETFAQRYGIDVVTAQTGVKK